MGLPRSLQLLLNSGVDPNDQIPEAILILAVLTALLLDATLTFTDHRGIVETQALTTSSPFAPHQPVVSW